MDNEQMLTLPEVAERMQVSIPTVRRWIKTGKLPATKPGGVYRVRGRDLDKFVDRYATGNLVPAPPSPAETVEERRLLTEIRPLVLLMDEQADTWASLARSDAVGSDGLHGEVVDKRRRVLEATEGVLESLSDEGLLDWHNPAHRPSRHARLELQAAFNRWTSAFFDVLTAHFEGPVGSEPESAEEKRLARWFGERRAS